MADVAKFRIYVKDPDNKSHEIIIDEKTNVYNVKKDLISKGIGEHPDDLRILYAAKQLCDSRACVDYNIQPDSTLEVIIKRKRDISFSEEEDVDKTYKELVLKFREFKLDQSVEVRDTENEPWKSGVVTSLDPPLVLAEGFSQPHKFRFVRHLQMNQIGANCQYDVSPGLNHAFNFLIDDGIDFDPALQEALMESQRIENERNDIREALVGSQHMEKERNNIREALVESQHMENERNNIQSTLEEINITKTELNPKEVSSSHEEESPKVVAIDDEPSSSPDQITEEAKLMTVAENVGDSSKDTSQSKYVPVSAPDIFVEEGPNVRQTCFGIITENAIYMIFYVLNFPFGYFVFRYRFRQQSLKYSHVLFKYPDFLILLSYVLSFTLVSFISRLIFNEFYLGEFVYVFFYSQAVVFSFLCVFFRDISSIIFCWITRIAGVDLPITFVTHDAKYALMNMTFVLTSIAGYIILGNVLEAMNGNSFFTVTGSILGTLAMSTKMVLYIFLWSFTNSVVQSDVARLALKPSNLLRQACITNVVRQTHQTHLQHIVSQTQQVPRILIDQDKLIQQVKSLKSQIKRIREDMSGAKKEIDGLTTCFQELRGERAFKI